MGASRRLRWWVGLMVAIASLFSASPAPAATFGDAGLIVFERLEYPDRWRSDSELYVLDPRRADGGSGDPVQLTNNEASDHDPVWAPDGQRVAFIRDKDIWTMSASGHDEVQLTSTAASEGDPAWSPDGTRLLFIRQTEKRWPAGDLYEIASSGGPARRIDAKGTFADPAWSPNGRKIALVRYRFFMRDETHDPRRDAETDIYVMRRNGTRLRNLTRGYVGGKPRFGKWEGIQPEWSPNGRKIAFSMGDWGCGVIFVMRPDGSRKRSVSPGECGDYEHLNASWSPQGDAIAYVAQADTGECGEFDQLRVQGLRDGVNEVLAQECSYSGMSTASWQPVCTVPGTDADEVLVGTTGRDLICGHGGADSISGGGGDDLIFGGAGDDKMYGGPGADVLNGQDGADRQGGGSGRDWLADLLGLDRLIGHRGRDILDARDAAGRDRMAGGRGVDFCRSDRADFTRGCR